MIWGDIMINNCMNMKDVLALVFLKIKNISKCQALGIRLEENGDYPYYSYNGFPEKFILKENILCKKDEKGNRILSSDNKNYLLECMCGNVIRGKFNPDVDFFTINGSFWSNNTSALLANTTEEDRQSDTRNYCNSCGYESVALIPIKICGQTIGLIQLNDKKIGMFTLELIEFLEIVAQNMGIIILNNKAYLKLLERQKKGAYSKSLEILLHELRAPIDTIFDALKKFESYKKNEFMNTHEKSEDMLKILKDNCFKMLTLSNNLIDLAYVNLGYVNVNKKKFDIVNLIKDITKEIEGIARNKDLEIRFNTKIAERIIYCDPDEIKHIMINLLSNAIKFTNRREKIIVSISQEKEKNYYFSKRYRNRNSRT